MDCPPGGKALIFDLDHRNGQVLNLVMGKRHDLGMAELPESVTKEGKNNSEHSLKDSQIHFAINGQCFLECFFHTPIFLLRKVTASINNFKKTELTILVLLIV